MFFADNLSLDSNAVRITDDGYMVADVRAARVGVQTYLGSEVGKPEQQIVRVYRPESEVFNKDALSSFTSIPLTNDHPPEMVTAANWKKYAVGNTGESVARDGEAMRVPLICKDADAIAAINGGKKQLSCGYTCDLKWESGVTPNGEAYDAIQTNIRGNHLAIVRNARGGPTLKIGDGKMTKMVTIDGHSVEVSDSAAILIDGLQKKNAELTLQAGGIAAKDQQIGELTAQVSTKDGEIAALNQRIKDAELTPEKLDAAVAERGKLIDAAKTVIPSFDATGKTDKDIRREVVKAKLGDAAVSMSDEAINGAFSAFVVAPRDPVRDSAIQQPLVKVGNVVQMDAAREAADKAHAAMIANLNKSAS